MLFSNVYMNGLLINTLYNSDFNVKVKSKQSNIDMAIMNET